MAVAGVGLAGQGIGVDHISAGPMAVHDHVVFDYHIPIKGDPFPHEVKEGYAYDGVDLMAAVGWHWGRAHLLTSLRLTPASRAHFAYDQDTDFKPGTDFTHGNAGPAKSRTFGLDQAFPLLHFRRAGEVGFDVGFLRQWTRYHRVTTYDLNTNPALPSNTYTRLISEQAIVYELRSSLTWAQQRRLGGWTARAKLGVTPVSAIFLRNYIPVVLAATSTEAYGGTAAIGLGHALGRWGVQISATAGRFNGYRAIEGFRREEYTLRLELERAPQIGRAHV